MHCNSSCIIYLVKLYFIYFFLSLSLYIYICASKSIMMVQYKKFPKNADLRPPIHSYSRYGLYESFEPIGINVEQTHITLKHRFVASQTVIWVVIWPRRWRIALSLEQRNYQNQRSNPKANKYCTRNEIAHFQGNCQSARVERKRFTPSHCWRVTPQCLKVEDLRTIRVYDSICIFYIFLCGYGHAWHTSAVVYL
jgi:hypothetical protein